MKRILLMVLAIFLTACSGKVDQQQLASLNGYWEISKAEMPDGATKEYTINPAIDFFEVKGKSGFRQKVMPQLDGTYRTGSSSEKITISDLDGGTFINYKTAYAQWKEQIIELDDEELVLKNNHGMLYHYKRFKPFTLKK